MGKVQHDIEGAELQILLPAELGGIKSLMAGSQITWLWYEFVVGALALWFTFIMQYFA